MTDYRLEDKLRDLEMLSLSERGADIGGRFDDKEVFYKPWTWGRSSDKVAPEPGSVGGTSEETDTNAHEQTNLQEEQRKLEENQRQQAAKMRDEIEKALELEEDVSEEENS
jgi:hypothetical protein